MNLLVVEDDKVIREGLCEFLGACGYHMVAAKDGLEAIRLFEEETIHLLILDIQIPYLSGLEVLKKIRQTSQVPALILTAFSDEAYQMDAFSHLADGYIEKPFSLPLLRVRIDSLLKRYYGAMETFTYCDTEVNFTSYTATYRGESVDMNAKEVEILKCLVAHQGQALTRQQIIDQVWKESDEIPYDRVIDVYIKELRKKLGLDCIVTIRNVGYKLERL